MAEIKVTVNFYLSLDGECENPKEVFWSWLVENLDGGISSEDIDNTDNYFIGIDSLELETKNE